MLNFCKKIGFGAMALSIQNRPTEQDALAVLEAAFKLGVDFVDTANVYCLSDLDIGHNERLICKALKKWENRTQVLVATKGGLERPDGAWTQNAKPKALRLACEKSLKALETERIFLYQLHAVDPKVPLEDSVGELKRLQDEGKIEHIGLSNVDISQIKQAAQIVKIESVQNRFNPLCQRDLYNGVISGCLEQKITYLAYSPVGGTNGHLSLSKHPLLLDIAHKYAMSSYQVMLAFALSKGPHVVVIPAASKIASVTDSMKTLNRTLDEADLKRINEIEMVV